MIYSEFVTMLRQKHDPTLEMLKKSRSSEVEPIYVQLGIDFNLQLMEFGQIAKFDEWISVARHCVDDLFVVYATLKTREVKQAIIEMARYRNRVQERIELLRSNLSGTELVVLIRQWLKYSNFVMIDVYGQEYPNGFENELTGQEQSPDHKSDIKFGEDLEHALNQLAKLSVTEKRLIRARLRMTRKKTETPKEFNQRVWESLASRFGMSESEAKSKYDHAVLTLLGKEA